MRQTNKTVKVSFSKPSKTDHLVQPKKKAPIKPDLKMKDFR